MLTAKELAKTLNGRQYTMEILPDEEREAKESGLVVIFGCSDDLVELRGAIDDEVGAYKGTTIYISKDGNLLDRPDCDTSECPYYKAVVSAAREIQVEWHNNSPNWTFKTSIPHETFSILDGEIKFCEGIVFNIEEVKDVMVGQKEIYDVLNNFLLEHERDKKGVGKCKNSITRG